MEKIFKTLEELRMLSGNSQLLHLKYHQSDLLKEILEYTYDPHRLFKVDEGKFSKGVFTQQLPQKQQFDVQDWYEYREILDHLVSIKSAKQSDINSLVMFINSYAEEFQDFMKRVLTKDLRLNMGIKKFQQVWPEFCNEPQVQLASKREGEPFVLGYYSRKFDGKRVYIKDGIPYSRSNKPCSIAPMQHILDQLQSINSFIPNFVLDGECLYFENGVEDFKKGISLCQSDERREGCDNISFVIFDMISKDKFERKQQYKAFRQEYEEMLELFHDKKKESPDYSLLPTKFPNIFIARQDEDMTTMMELYKANNWEGLMYRNAYASYEFKRTRNLQKIKKMDDIELKLVDMEEGTGRHAGRLGAFIVEYEGNTVNVGSGFTDEQREEYWTNKHKYIGEYVKVQYFEKTTNNEGKPSLRFPVYMCFRNIHTKEEFLIK